MVGRVAALGFVRRGDDVHSWCVFVCESTETSAAVHTAVCIRVTQTCIQSNVLGRTHNLFEGGVITAGFLGLSNGELHMG